jgi:hypothetical protein
MTRSTRPACQMLAVFTIASTLALTGCAPTYTQPGGTMTTNNNEESSGGTRPAKVVFADFLDTVDDIVQHSGATFPKWDRRNVAGYNAGACAVKGGEDGNKYTSSIDGGPVDDPDKAVQEMKSHWEAQGYTTGNIFTDMGGNTTAREVNATTPSGIVVQFTPGKTRSSVTVQSDCTLDPLAKETTTDRIPLGEAGNTSSPSAGT